MISEERKLLRKRIGENLKKVRIEHEYSIKKLAILLKVDRRTILSWESGKSMSKFLFLIEMSELYKVKVDYILGMDDFRKNNL